MKYAESMLDLIGNTPMVKLQYALTGSAATVLCKLESFNPGGSIKDRVARYVLRHAEKLGYIKPGDTVCDSTSGNTGVGVAMVAAAMGYKAVFTIPDTASKEKVDLVKSFGAQVIMTPSAVPWDDPRSGFQVAKHLAKEKGYYWLDQFNNQLNPQAHYEETGPEIWTQTEGKVTHFVTGMGTGGTISGVGRYLKDKNSGIRVIGVEPVGSLFLPMWEKRPLPPPRLHRVEGIGTDMPVKTFHPKFIDRIIQVDDNDAFLQARFLGRSMGLSVGGSTGAVFHAVRHVCRSLDEKAIVVFLACDSGIRYINKYFSDDWMKEHRFKLEEEFIANA
jgi:cystathionine beta-synthase